MMGSLFASSGEGIRRAVTKADVAGEQIAAGDLDVQSFVDLDEAQIMVKANAATMRAGDEMLGTLLDVKR